MLTGCIAVGVRDKRVHWGPTENVNCGNGAVANGTIYSAGFDGIVARDDRDGTELWRWNGNPGGSFKPSLATTNVVFFTSFAFDRTYAIDVNTHQKVWSYPLPCGLSLGPDGVLYCVDQKGQIDAFATFADTDNDFLDDAWERRNGLDTTRDDAATDRDGDGLSNRDEAYAGTAADVADSDGDGLSDGDEISKFHSDPLKADTDGDGTDDRTEVRVNSSDPTGRDTDGDELSDTDEIKRYGTQPTVADSDGDGFPDGWEILLGTDPRGGSSKPVTISMLNESFEGGVLPAGWRADPGAKVGWEVTTETANDGRYGLRSLPVRYLEDASVEFRGRFESGTLMFDAAVLDGEVKLYVDGIAKVSTLVGGFIGWKQFSSEITAGLHVLRWQFSGPRYVFQGDGRASIDHATFNVAAVTPNPTPPPNPAPTPTPTPTPAPIAASGGGGGGGSFDTPLLFLLVMFWLGSVRRRVREARFFG